MKKEDRLSLEEIAALIERVEARSLKKGDGQIIKAVIEKTFTLRQLYWDGKIPSKDELRRLLEIPKPDKSDD
jgi:hypothetical protein